MAYRRFRTRRGRTNRAGYSSASFPCVLENTIRDERHASSLAVTLIGTALRARDTDEARSALAAASAVGADFSAAVALGAADIGRSSTGTGVSCSRPRRCSG